MTRTRDLALAALAALSFVGAVAAGGADLGAGAARRGVPLGVDPARAARFQGETFVCDGGAVSLPFSRVNDDYCDCADGADEPGTSACSNGSFHCRNRGHQPVNVPSSRVGDGVCDCCDGSDERAASRGAACANTCAGAGASRRDALRRELSDHRAGLRKKAALVDAAPAERKRWMEKRERLARDADAASAAADAARAAADDASAEHERAKEEAKAFEVVSEPPASSPDGTAVDDGIHRLEDADENADYVAADDGSRLADLTSDLADPADALPAAGETDEERGERIARQWIKTDGASPESRATEGSANQPGASGVSHLVDVDDDAADLAADGAGATADASPAGPTAPEPGSPNEKQTRARSFSFRSWFRGGKGDASDAHDVDTPEARSARARLTKAAAASSTAAAAATAAESRRDETKKKFDDVAADLARFVGARAEFQHMLGQCYAAKVDKYAYSVCPFAESTQDGTRLGRMAALEATDASDVDGGDDEKTTATRFLFRDGERCWNGPSRSISVSLTCGAAERLFAVTEPSRCEYAAVLATPAVCDEAVAAALEAELAEMEREIAGVAARGEELR
jgi:protein kinase C substrate 80K-H